MKQISESSSSSTRPAAVTTGSPGYFCGADLIANTPGTKVSYTFLNDLQGQFADIMSRAGVTPTLGAAGDRNLYDSIMAFVNPKIDVTTGDGRYLKLVGGTLSGALYLPSADPSTNYMAAHKKYVDDRIAATTFATGTRMAFAMVSAPTGWSQDVGLNDRMLRVVSTAGNGIGGTSSPILMDSSTVPSHTHSGSTSNNNVDHTHGVGTIFVSGGLHQHVVIGNDSNNSHTGPGDFSPGEFGNVTSDITSALEGGHTHTFGGSTAGQSQTHVHGFTTGANAGNANWTPKYINMIICQRD
jgi:hypothetical protein